MQVISSISNFIAGEDLQFLGRRKLFCDVFSYFPASPTSRSRQVIVAKMSASMIPRTNLVKKSSSGDHVSRNPKVGWQRVSSASRRCRRPYCHLATHSDVRRSGNYKPSLWGFHYIQSLDDNEYMEGRCLTMASELIERVKKLLDEDMDLVRQLELIDDLQRLGISYHFGNKIHQILNRIYLNDHTKCCKNNKMALDDDDEEEICRDLYSIALEFRILREHGFKVSQEVFDCFKEEGNFKTSLCEDVKGLLQLYEASFLSRDGEESLEQARDFATTSLHHIKFDHHRIEDRYLSLLVGHALELPFHLRSRRPYATWFISYYERRPDMNPVVLQLAKLDFNILQATHRAELKSLSRWWKQTCLAEKLPFARDRVVECYLISIGLFEPQYGYSRIIGTKVNALVTIIDDMFDVYATMDELILFNNLIQRWDIEAIDQLPHYMQMCFLALNNFINEMAYDVLNQQGFQIIPYLRKSWADLCTSYMQEAKWYSEGYKPRLEEYIENAWISISVPVMLTHAFFALANPIEKDAVESLFQNHDLVRYSGMIARLTNDLGTSQDEMKRGDVPKSVQCCMNERCVDIEEAREHIKLLISEAWKKMNDQSAADSQILPQHFVRCAVEFGRIAHYVYNDGDGHGIQNSKVKDRISTLLFHPIP